LATARLDSPSDVVDADKTCADSEHGMPERASRVIPVQGLEDVEVVDGEPAAASLIPRAVTTGELLFDDGATQTFEVGGDTSYVEADGRPTEGEWYVDEDGRFCSFWPPTYRACYELRWIVEGDDIVGLSFTELSRGARFDGRYKTLAHGAGS
jgi:hypothetical protein